MKIIGVIPARYASTRFPGNEAYVATDDERIFQVRKIVDSVGDGYFKAIASISQERRLCA